MKGEEVVRELNADQLGFLNHWRSDVRSRLPEDLWDEFDTPAVKLAIVQNAFDSGQARKESPGVIEMAGVLFGDALAAELALKWVHITDPLGSGLALIHPDVMLTCYPLDMIAKRALEDEHTVDVFGLFHGTCHLANEQIRPNASWWRRIFGPNPVRRSPPLPANQG